MENADRGTDCIMTFTGRSFFPLDPRPEDISIDDIGHALSLQCRFAGHTTTFYSIAEHCYHLSLFVPPEDALWALLHDASETWIHDISRPVKNLLGEPYKRIENNIMQAVCTKFHLPFEMPASVKEMDNRILGDERDTLMQPSDNFPWPDTGKRIGVRIQCFPPEAAYKHFMRRFNELITKEYF